MNETPLVDQGVSGVQDFFTQPSIVRSILILIASMLVAYWLSRFIAMAIVSLARTVSKHSDTETDDEKFLRLRRVETYLSVSIAATRLIIAVVAGVGAWYLLSPNANATTGVAAIGVGTIFVVFAGQTLGSLLRDVAAGATMIIEKWFNIGDYVRIEPFPDVAGVIERLTLRSTKIRHINGEIIWVHNQHMMAVHVTPRGVRRMAVDIFVKDRERGGPKLIG
ncbi:MAG TPA: mechanosensitive ion channel family protein [Candidatus Saccharimonadales bacterium]|nr:mechanosensitive ion channel family protein [Candidatus Saccharimonadales bacterium]